MTFVILNSLIHEEPVHIKNLVKKRNLFDLIKYCLYKINKQGMLSLELIQELKNVVKKNIIAQSYYAKDETKSSKHKDAQSAQRKQPND